MHNLLLIYINVINTIKSKQKILNLQTGVGIDLCNNKLIYVHMY